MLYGWSKGTNSFQCLKIEVCVYRYSKDFISMNMKNIIRTFIIILFMHVLISSHAVKPKGPLSITIDSVSIVDGSDHYVVYIEVSSSITLSDVELTVHPSSGVISKSRDKVSWTGDINKAEIVKKEFVFKVVDSTEQLYVDFMAISSSGNFFESKRVTLREALQPYYLKGVNVEGSQTRYRGNQMVIEHPAIK
jgi:hypothetical protein